MNPLNLYITTCRMVLQSGADDASAWADISRLLSCLRQSLTCCVCGNILSSPTTSSVSSCNHGVCKGCIGGKMRLKPACSRCIDYTKFVENSPVKVLIQCYKKLCEYIISSALHRRWGNLNGGSAANLAEIVQEGAELSLDFHSSAALYQNINTNSLRSAIVSLFPKVGYKVTVGSSENGQEGLDKVTNGNSSSYSVTESNSTKIMIKRTNQDGSESDTTNDESSADSRLKRPGTRDVSVSLEMAKCFRTKRKNCRCGVATQNPGKLTCCGQRCPCYVDQRACVQCRCRGCRNPHRYGGKNVHYQGIQLDVQEMSEVDCYVENMVETNGDVNT